MPDSPKKLLVTGATGKTGTAVVRQLRARGADVRALVHRADERSAALAQLGAEVVVGDVLDLASMAAATRGITAAYFTYPVELGLLDATTTFAYAAAESGVGAVVNMSQLPARPDAASNASRQHWLAERILDWSPLPVTHLRPTFFAEWLAIFLRQDGTLALPFGDGRHAPVAAEDIASVIAAILIDPARHAGQVYKLFGAEEMDHYQITAEMSAALGNTVTYLPVAIDEFEEQLRHRHFPEHTIQHVRSVAADYQNAVFAGNNDVVKTVGGHDPLTVQEFVIRNKHFFDGTATTPLRAEVTG
jgi:NAD(P)H dehydrogenase (quinone)